MRCRTVVGGVGLGVAAAAALTLAAVVDPEITDSGTPSGTAATPSAHADPRTGVQAEATRTPKPRPRKPSTTPVPRRSGGPSATPRPGFSADGIPEREGALLPDLVEEGALPDLGRVMLELCPPCVSPSPR